MAFRSGCWSFRCYCCNTSFTSSLLLPFAAPTAAATTTSTTAVAPTSMMMMTTASFYQRCGVSLQPRRRRRRLYSSSSSPSCYFSEPAVESCEAIVTVKERKLEDLLCRRWFIPEPSTKVSRILVSRLTEDVKGIERPGYLGNLRFDLQDMGSSSTRSFEDDIECSGPSPSFYVMRDDLLHPLLGGNKLRKLDALLPQLEEYNATDVVTCGGCQSAHTAALACACAERGIKAHLLLRGEKPSSPTGYNLLSNMYGDTTYVPRSEYSDRTAMLKKHALRVAGSSGTVAWLDEEPQRTPVAAIEGSEKRVVVVKEGAGDAVAVLGLIRLVHYMSQPSVFGNGDVRIQIVVDSGTGTSAVGLALGVSLLKLPWRVIGVMLAGTVEGYDAQTRRLVTAFCEQYNFTQEELGRLPLSWEERWRPRKFGKILPEEVRTCQTIAQRTGILLDPIYTLAGWETTTRLSGQMENESDGHRSPSSKVVMLHTGGMVGLFGLAQRYPTEF